MGRIKIEFNEPPVFSCRIPVRITDLNYGGHVGNDTILSIIHEARVQFLESLGYSELNLEGVSLIMGDVAIEFKAELFYGDTIIASVFCSEFTAVSFDIFYSLRSAKNDLLIASAKTGMVCFDYKNRKVSRLPAEVLKKLKGQ